MRIPEYIDACAVLRALDVVSLRLLRASEEATLSELRAWHTELEALSREALQTPVATPVVTSTTPGITSATTENPIAARETAPRPSSESLLRHLPTDALTREARTLLAALEVTV